MAEHKLALLEQIAEDVHNLEETYLPAYRRSQGQLPVGGEGNADARIMFVGEAPGAEEARTGRPFVGQAGEVFDGLLESVGLQSAEVHITSVLQDRPPRNQDPHAEEILANRPFLSREIDVIRLAVIATLGRFALSVILDEFDMPQRGEKLSDLHGKILPTHAPYRDIVVLPLYHPAAVLYNPDLRQRLEDDLQVPAALVLWSATTLPRPRRCLGWRPGCDPWRSPVARARFNVCAGDRDILDPA